MPKKANANDGQDGIELRAESILQRNLEVRWAIDRIVAEGFDDKGKPKLQWEPLLKELRAEFPDTLNSNTKAGKRAKPARDAAKAIFASIRDPLRACVYDGLQQLEAEAWREGDLELVRKILADLRKMYGLDEAEKIEHSGPEGEPLLDLNGATDSVLAGLRGLFAPK